MSVHIYRVGKGCPCRRKRYYAVDIDGGCYGFTLEGATDDFYLVSMPRERGFDLLDVINHEVLHLTLNRVGETTASNRLDRLSNTDLWEESYRCLGGL